MTFTPTTAGPISPDTTWFTDVRFGLFVHWGLYSLTGRDAWYKQEQRVAEVDYDRYFGQFRADRYDPQAWAQLALDAGIRYVVLTTKHHDGFCLWDSAYTDYKATNTPAKRDLVREMVDAFRSVDLRIGLYHSLIDWHHPAFPIDGMHPRRDDGAQGDRDITVYRKYLHDQVRELVTEFSPDLLWFDFSYPSTWPNANPQWWGGKGREDWGSEDLVSMIRELAPNVLINDRLDLPASANFMTPEEHSLDALPLHDGALVPWETCRTLNGMFGYAPYFEDWLDADGIVALLVDSVSKGGNLLLNVGPTGRGEIEPRATSRLREVGQWIRSHGESIYGAGPSSVPAPPGCLATERDGRIFLHMLAWPGSPLVLEGLGDRVRYASFLHDALEVRTEVVDQAAVFTPHMQPIGPSGSLAIHLPRKRPDVLVPVVELVLD